MILLSKLFSRSVEILREILRILFSPNRAGNNGNPTPRELKLFPLWLRQAGNNFVPLG